MAFNKLPLNQDFHERGPGHRRILGGTSVSPVYRLYGGPVCIMFLPKTENRKLKTFFKGGKFP
jgi:hypothetical protein